MLRRLIVVLALLVPLAACQRSSTSETGAPSETSAAPGPSDPATETEMAAPEAAPADATAEPGAEASAPAPAPTPAAGSPDAPRAGTDYVLLDAPQPTWGQGKIEVAEVFSYMCIHCAEFQPAVNAWKQRMPADVRWEYVPAVFGGAWDQAARAYFAAELLGVRERSHDAIFKAIHIDREMKTGSAEEYADLYAKQGAERGKFLDTMSSFGVTAKLGRAKQFAQRTGVTGTPTIIVAGKYRVSVTEDRGFPGMLATVDFLLAQERAAATP
jgi:thiol:disulfide interchange protein DsbA